MKKLILVLIVVIAFAFPVVASDDYTGTVTVGADYNSDGELIDIAEFEVETDISETVDVSVALETEGLLFDDSDVAVITKLKYDSGDGETGELKAKVDPLTGDLKFDGKYEGLLIGDDMTVGVKAQYKYPVGTYYTVGTLVYDLDEETEIIVEGRVDSDGTVPFSAEVQVIYAFREDIDVIVGYELNDWSDDINDWDDMEIEGDVDTAYVRVEFRF